MTYLNVWSVLEAFLDSSPIIATNNKSLFEIFLRKGYIISKGQRKMSEMFFILLIFQMKENESLFDQIIEEIAVRTL